ncbi:class I SAM-dependent methyltransferase [Trinickia dinghuensis]|uniref:Class I SAM-dependent methyltransferase n=1 Tax=Trinickia dinghuensis TaxID=2291023 RepID=A0A3D8JXM7_9BURK|nr:class I SAM-dependent methyltransferase [Trinickia dinghuensis]RDU97883.1 class I SAM-dependent methyltransferase [Trinickia dinghuensis]
MSAPHECLPAAPLEGAGEPSPWIERWSHLIAPGGAVLDIAAGSGRHARWFARRGHPVVAIDRAEAALGALSGIAGVEPIPADLENGSPWPLPDTRRFAAVIVTNYLYRPLLPRLAQLLAPGGVLLYETFARGNETVGKPSNPAFLLAPGELLDAVRGRLAVVAYEDGYLAAPRPAFVQRICAVLPARPQAGGATDGAAPAHYTRYDLIG